jgi:hypothetical protein
MERRRVTDNNSSAVMEILRVIHADLSMIKSDLGTVKLDVSSHSSLLNILLQDTREIRSAINDIERTRVSTGEIEALHHDVNRVQRGLAELGARVDAIERR